MTVIGWVQVVSVRFSVLLLAVVLVVLVGCGDGSPPSARKTARQTPVAAGPGAPAAYIPPHDDGYVGTQSCARCHAEIAAAFQSHPMANSIRRMVDSSVPGHQDSARISGLTRYYEVDGGDGSMVHHEKMDDVDGQLIFDQAVRMDYIVGSGRRAFAYLHQQGELLFQSPLNWYSESGSWDLSPGFVKDDPRRFGRRITDDCLACHAGRVAAIGKSLDRYQNPAFHEMSIGCENCHGPGRDHEAYHYFAQVDSNSRDPIVNPARLPHPARESVCNQCHLQAVARVLRVGRSEFDFRPGQNIEDIWTVLDPGVDISKAGSTRAVNHVQQMRASECYVGSNGELGCISCHDPHRIPDAATRISFYRSRCLTCHTQDHCTTTPAARSQNGNSCIQCHMPHRSSNNISHVTQTDHRIVRQSGVVSESPDESNDVRLDFFDGANQRLPDWESRRALAAAVWLYLEKRGQSAPSSLEELLTPAVQKVPEDHMSLTLLGAFFRQRNEPRKAIAVLERARHIAAGEEAAVSALLTLYYLGSQWENALQCADQMIELNPGEARFHSLRADTLKQLGRLDDGLSAAQRALELNPTLLPVREWLVKELQTSGRHEEYRQAQQQLDRIKAAIAAASQQSTGEDRDDGR